MNMTEEDFIKLRVHLEHIRPLVDQFCKKHGFQRIEGSSVGRYPRIRLQRCDGITLWLDLWMGLDSEGQRFNRFRPDIPYELSAGAFVDEQSENGDSWRFQKSFVIWQALPFSNVADALSEALETGVATLQQWDLAFLHKEGLRVELGK